MAVTLNETQRNAIATKLGDLKILQTLLISNEEKLLNACKGDEDIGDRLEDIMEDDRKNLGILDKTIDALALEATPQQKTKNLVQEIEKMMSEDELSLHEKAIEHEGLKHLAVMTGLLVHKVAQTAGNELDEAINPLNQVNFENRAHQEQLKSVVQVLGTRELLGKEPDNSIWAQAEDAIAAVKGLFTGLS